MPTFERFPSTALATALMTVSALLLAGPASAAPGDDATIVASSYSATTPAGGRTVTTQAVGCPAGQRVVGGGNGPAATFDPSYTFQPVSGPLDESGTAAGSNDGEIARFWTASIVNNNPTPMTSYPERVFANCSASSDAVIEVTTDSVAATATKTVTTSCPAGTRAIGGGFADLSAGADYLLRASNPIDETGQTDETFTGDVARGWLVTVTRSPSAGTGTFSVFALCSQNSYATVVADSFLVVPVGQATKVVTCPPGKPALGGGIGTTSPVGPYVMASAPVSAAGTTAATNTGDVARGWLASAFGASGGPARYLTFAICAGDPPAGGSDTTPPETRIAKHPKKKTKKAKAKFTFSSSEPGSSFQCKLDKGAFAACTSPFSKKVKASRKGTKHVFSVVAIDAAGNRDASPATYAWKAKKKAKRKG